MRVGFVGLGAMGLPMARNLVEKGHVLTVASRSRGPVRSAVGFGAVDGGDPAGVAAASEVTILCLPDGPDVVAVVDAMLPVVTAGRIVVDCSTIAPETERAQHERVGRTGAAYLEAPMSGGTVGAERGTLTLIVGGSDAALEAARPALESVASLIVHVGGPGMGQAVKLCNNLIYAAQVLATSEAFVMAAKAGVDLKLMHEILLASTGDCTAVRTRVPFEGVIPESPASNGLRPGFMTDLMAKDLDLALHHAVSAQVPLLSTALVRQVLTVAQQEGLGGEDFSAIGKVIRQLAGVP
jgi:3-hydroxyisobutyrate dehydrogenase